MKKVVKISGVEDLRNDLSIVYSELRSGKLGLSEAKQAANVAGKIMSTVKNEMEYNKMTQSKKKISFME